MNKKRVGAFASFLVILVNLIGSVSASRLREGFEQLIEWTQDASIPVFEALLGVGSSTEFFFSKVLVLLLLFMVIFTIVKKIPNLGKRNPGVAFVIAAVISIICIRYITDNEFFVGMLLPYGTLGIALIVFIPFLLYFYFVYQSVPSTFGRRIAWIIYGVTFLVLWGSREYTSNLGEANWIYVSGIILVVLALIFDKNIKRYFGMRELATWERSSHNARIANLQAEYNRIAHVDSRHASDRRAEILDELRNLRAEL